VAFPTTLETVFAGMRQDDPRDNIRNQALWNCVDFVPQSLGAPLRKRAAWYYASPDLGGSMIMGMCRTFYYGAGFKNVAVTLAREIYEFTDTTSSLIGSWTGTDTISQNPVVHRKDADSWLVVIPRDSGVDPPMSWDGITPVATLAGSPPPALFADVWNDRTVLGNSLANPGRVWFSALGTAEVWPTESWYDFSDPVVALAAMRNAILVFHFRSTSRLKGTTPASPTTSGDLTADAPFEVGCVNAHTVVKYNDTVIWADLTGVYQTDGVALKNLTADGGISSLWFTTLRDMDDTYRFAAGVVHDTYIITITSNGQLLDCFCYDLLRGFWYRMQNMPGFCFMRVPGRTAEKVYMGLSNEGRVASLYLLFHPHEQADEADANGVTIQPFFETPFYRARQSASGRTQMSFSLQQWKWLFANWDMHSHVGAPVLEAGYLLDPCGVNYTTIGSFEQSDVYKRARRELGFQSSGVAFRIKQIGGSSETRFHAIETEFQALEENRLKQ